MYWQYTTALAGSVLAVTSPIVISNVDNAIESFIVVSPVLVATFSTSGPDQRP